MPRRSTSTPSPALTKTALRSSSKRRKKEVSGTPSARDSDCNVVSEGEVMPFSILDSMPSERLVVAARSAIVMPSFFAERPHLMPDRHLEDPSPGVACRVRVLLTLRHQLGKGRSRWRPHAPLGHRFFAGKDFGGNAIGLAARFLRVNT